MRPIRSLKLIDGKIVNVDEPALTALNMRLRDDYSTIAPGASSAGTRSSPRKASTSRLELPHVAFNRKIGEFPQRQRVNPKGIILSDADWAKVRDDYLPSSSDGEYLNSLMKPSLRRGRICGAGLPRRRSASTTSPAISNTFVSPPDGQRGGRRAPRHSRKPERCNRPGLRVQ